MPGVKRRTVTVTRPSAIFGVWFTDVRFLHAPSPTYPERFGPEALAHKSKVVHRAYAKRALMKLPSLEAYEQQAAANATLTP